MTTERMRSVSSPKLGNGLIGRLTQAEAGAGYLVFLILVTYTLAPLAVASQLDEAQSFTELAAVSGVAAIAVWLGSRLRILDPLIDGRLPRVVMGPETFISVIWTLFVLFVFVAWSTADQIPLLAALGGADADTIAVLREQFLKAREGWQASFVYINAMLSGALIPYSIALMFLHSVSGRWLAFAFFMIFCISFVEKAFFMKAALPLLYLVAQRRVRLPVSPTTLLWGILGILFLVTAVSGAGTANEDGAETFFSVAYIPQGPLQHLLWRSVAIPVVTAADAIRVLNEEFGGKLLLGTSSSFLAALLGQERVEFERLVFAAQWGQNETGTGSSNSVYITEAYVNFGWAGVALFSVVVGLIMRMFSRSRDEAFRALWPLFVLGVFTSGLIGLMLSNGYILFFALALLFRFRQQSPKLPRYIRSSSA